MDDDTTRAAAGIAVTLGTQLMSASFTMLTLLAAFATFFFDRRQPSSVFTLSAAVAFAAFILATVIGGKAIAALYRTVSVGCWSPDVSKKGFSWQAGLTLLGIAAFGVSLLFSGSRMNS